MGPGLRREDEGTFGDRNPDADSFTSSQDEGEPLMALRKFLIQRRPRQRPSRRTHGADPGVSLFSERSPTKLVAGPGHGGRRCAFPPYSATRRQFLHRREPASP